MVLDQKPREKIKLNECERDEGDGRNEGKEGKGELTTNLLDTLVSANEIVAPVMRSAVMGDFHEPKGA